MTEVKKLEDILNKLEKSREHVMKIAEGGFLGLNKKGGRCLCSGGASINFVNQDEGNTSISLSGKKGRPRKSVVSLPISQPLKVVGKKRGRPSKSLVGGGFIGTKSDKIGMNYGNQGYQPTPEKMGRGVVGGRVSGGRVSGGNFDGVVGGAKKKKVNKGANDWVSFVKSVQEKNGISYKDAMSLASKLRKQ